MDSLRPFHGPWPGMSMWRARPRRSCAIMCTGSTAPLFDVNDAGQGDQVTRIPAADRRSALVRAALRVVADRGVAQATTRAIVAEAGMSLASFHYAFQSRDELMVELIRYVVAEEATAVLPEPSSTESQGQDDIQSLRQILRDGLQRYADHMSRDPLREKAMLELTQYALRSPELRHLAVAQYERYHALAAEALDTAARRSGSVWLHPVGEVARLLVSLTDGLTIAWLVDRNDTATATLLDFAADSVAALGRPA
ncbi:TetR family transcriptional regulator [Cryobacterium sp. TMN-39-2]|uniref:TetR family transcriptional regulator n=1 Tax=Cryobacterium zongtaii TaxID=1259217 RepID=A0A2S3ZA38_9MICO|nr:TetR family transcriptional regulator [Cryobacterium zongtaii]POH66175.1 TetR family transcriptional regulator [Cryobacterium zongtaii]TFC46848.1 TetR family transcriptional regulator [Cryobacterium sp. TMN-39-2]